MLKFKTNSNDWKIKKITVKEEITVYARVPSKNQKGMLIYKYKLIHYAEIDRVYVPRKQ